MEHVIQSTAARAIALASQGFYVFPCGKNKHPIAAAVPHGHLDASNDPEQLATWFGEYPDAFIGVHVERSGIVVLDLDLRPDDNKDGFAEIEVNWLGVPEGAFAYDTPSGGKHIWFRAPNELALPPQTNYRAMRGVDRKSGSSYVVVYATALPDDIQARLPDAPEWLLDVKPKRTVGDAFEGGVDEWLNSLEDGEPDGRVIAAIERIPDKPFSHPEMVERQYEFIRLAAEGAIGVRHGLDILREEWTRPPWNTEDYRVEFDTALESGIKRHGAELTRIQGLPNYLDSLDLLGSTTSAMLMGAPRNKRFYFEVINRLIAEDLNDHRIASLVWSAPSVKQIAREWGIDFLYASIQKARVKRVAPVENPALDLDDPEINADGFILLTDEERAVAESAALFPDRYIDWAASKVNVLNTPYHLQNGLAVMSLCLGGRVFVPLKTRAMGVNLFQLGLGQSSTGKSESISLMNEVLRPYFADDASYNLGSNPSPEALQGALIERDNKAGFFNTDEASAPLTEFMTKSYTAGMTDRLTSYYEGLVPPMLRTGRPELNKSAVTSFNIGMFGTPDKVTSIITKEQFEAGFMARFLFTIGDPNVDDPHQFDETQSLERVRHDTDPTAAAMVGGLAAAAGRAGGRKWAVISTDEVLDRLSENRRRMNDALKDDTHWDMLNPSVRRLGDSVRKIATLLAVVDRSDLVRLPHALKAIWYAERFLQNAQTVSRLVASSQFARECDLIEQYVVSAGGSVSAAKLGHRFRNIVFRDLLTYLESLVFQGRLKHIEANKDHGDLYEVNQVSEPE